MDAYAAKPIGSRRLVLLTVLLLAATITTSAQTTPASSVLALRHPTLWESYREALSNGDSNAFGLTIAGALVALGVLIFAAASICDPMPKRAPARLVSSPPPPPEPSLPNPEFDKHLANVLALAEGSDDFSDEWFEREARQNLDVLLRDAHLIDARSAERELRCKKRSEQLEQLAQYAERLHGLVFSDTLKKLEAADTCQRRMLAEARRIARAAEARPKAPPPPPPDPVKMEAERRVSARQQELEALEHERQRKQRELEVEKLDRQIRDSRSYSKPDLAAERRQEARREAEEKIATELDAQEVAANAAEEKVARAQKRCVGIYQDPHILAGAKRARILEVLDQFNFKYDILPRGVAEFIEAGLEEDQIELA